MPECVREGRAGIEGGEKQAGGPFTAHELLFSRPQGGEALRLGDPQPTVGSEKGPCHLVSAFLVLMWDFASLGATGSEKWERKYAAYLSFILVLE